MKQIDIDQFCNDLSESPTLNNIQGTVNELELANLFSKFFNNKIDTLRTSFRIDAYNDVEREPLASVKLNNLISYTSDEIHNVIASCPNKSCQLDPIPTWL